jgi:hypothetical protein
LADKFEQRGRPRAELQATSAEDIQLGKQNLSGVERSDKFLSSMSSEADPRAELQATSAEDIQPGDKP